GGAGGEATEICVNFLDDDLDGLPDCTDPACKAEFLCAPPPEVGWQGPVALWQGPGDAPAPSCAQSGGYEQAKAGGKAGLSVPPVACADCACGPPKGVACQVTTTGFFATGDCSGPKASLTVPVNVCQGFVTTGMDPASARWESAPAAGGACLPQQLGSHQIPPLVWSGKASTCGEPLPTGGGCGPGVCVPRPHAPFGAGLCIYHDGNQSCPSGPYAQKLVYYAGADDSRQCSGCTCLDPTGTSCQGTTALYTDTGCTVDQVVLSQVGQCAPLPPDPTPPPPPYKSLRSMIYVGASAGTGSCAPVPSQASGGAVESGPITFCCF
ncbi:MAG: hypothetical protein HY744_08785, partial [Deltaproteobacteria bacterium]|nr:hypothetical protein [Deltaproteobacteria bacterium]